MADSRAEAERLAALGGEMAAAGDYSGASTMLEAALRGLRGQQTEAETRAYGNLGSLYAALGRRFEAILLWRRGQAVSEALDLRLISARHCANLCGAYAALELWDFVREQWQRCVARIDTFPEAEQEGVRNLFLWPRIYLALHDGDVETAQELSRTFQATYGALRDPTTRALAAVMRADLLAAQGQRARALEVLAAAEVIEGMPLLDRIYVAYQVAEHLQQAGRVEEARERAAGALAWVDTLLADTGPGDLSIAITADLARLLADDAKYATAAQRALDLAGGSVLARIAQLDDAARRIPELCQLPAEDVAWIAELRVTYQLHQKDLIARVTELLGDKRNAPELFLESDDPDDTYLRICAWCSRVGTRNGRWLPLAHYLPSGYGAPVSHGICRDCRNAAMAPESV